MIFLSLSYAYGYGYVVYVYPSLTVISLSVFIHISMSLGAVTLASFSVKSDARLSPSSQLSFSGEFPAKQHKGSVVVCSTSKHASNKALTRGVVFEPFEEVKKEFMLVPTVPHLSLARHNYTNDSESVINDQIKSVLSYASLY